jgi:heme/copper-type cytochrome/quinol oxidase subunit 2
VILLVPLLAAVLLAAAEEPVEIVVSRAGFKPKVVNLRKGEPARLLLKSEDDEHCFALDALRIEKRILAGKTTTVDIVPDRAGSFPFYCCLEPENETLKGKLLISE